MPRFRTARPDARLLPLPWSTPLAQWPQENLVALPRGISRHVVRFIKVGAAVYAAKEVNEALAMHEYRLLHDLERIDSPAVRPIGVVSDRVNDDGDHLDAILITRHLKFSLPYRSLFSMGVRHDTVNRLIDALVVLIARIHLVGFLWGDISLSNVLFLRDASQFSAYLVDAETGELHEKLTNGQREHDIMNARVNLFGELCDLKAGGLLDGNLEPLMLVDLIEQRYRELWRELTGVEEFSGTEMHRIEGRVRRLNALGFDVAELDITTSEGGDMIKIQPKVVDAGHHSRRLMGLTGMDVEEHQARRLLNDLDTFRWRTGQSETDEAIVAHQWLQQHFEVVVNAVPEDLWGKREPAQLFHEVLDYRWYESERQWREVPILEAAQGYVRDVLSKLPDEDLGEMALSDPDEQNQLPRTAEQDDIDNNDQPFCDPWDQENEDADPNQLNYLDISLLRNRES